MQLAKHSMTDCFCDLLQFNYFSNQVAKFSNQIANQIATFQTESLHLVSSLQNGFSRDLNASRDCHLPIAGIMTVNDFHLVS